MTPLADHHHHPATAVRVAALAVAVSIAGCTGGLRWDPVPGGGGTGTAPAEPAPRVSGDSYRVRSGDTLYSIAFRHNLDYRELARWNGISSSYLIVPGQQLRMTPPPQAVASAPAVRPPTQRRDPPPIPETDLSWQWPLRGAVVTRFKPPGSKGIDVSGSLGAPVVAAAGGHVVYSGSALKGYGQLIIIKHNEAFLTAYGYNKRRLVKQGDTVRAGEKIGEVGYGPNRQELLHFEVRRRGKPVDPLTVLPLGQG